MLAAPSEVSCRFRHPWCDVDFGTGQSTSLEKKSNAVAYLMRTETERVGRENAEDSMFYDE